MPNAALLLAAGKGSRIQNLIADKVLAPLCSRPVIAYSADAFRRSGEVQVLVIAYRDEDQQRMLAEAVYSTGWKAGEVFWVKGGADRQDSVLHGLRSLPPEIDLVFIHDAARPMIETRILEELARKAEHSGAACLARRVTDTIKETAEADGGAANNTPLRTLDRSRLWAMETPQVFRLSLILPAYESAHAQGLNLTDDTAAVEAAGVAVALVESPNPNPKLTMAADLAYLEFLLGQQRNARRG